MFTSWTWFFFTVFLYMEDISMITVYEVRDLALEGDPLVVALDPFTAARKVKELNEAQGLAGSSSRFVYCPKQVEGYWICKGEIFSEPVQVVKRIGNPDAQVQYIKYQMDPSMEGIDAWKAFVLSSFNTNNIPIPSVLSDFLFDSGRSADSSMLSDNLS